MKVVVYTWEKYKETVEHAMRSCVEHYGAYSKSQDAVRRLCEVLVVSGVESGLMPVEQVELGKIISEAVRRDDVTVYLVVTSPYVALALDPSIKVLFVKDGVEEEKPLKAFGLAELMVVELLQDKSG